MKSLPRPLLLPLAAALGFSLIGCSERASLRGTAETSPYNVFFLTVDTLRADHLGSYGYPRATSPFLDRLAEQSTRFEWALVQWPKTGPSFASLFTSTYGSTSGVARKTGRFGVPESLDLFAEILDTAGFETMALVSNGCLTRQLHYDQGFDTYVEHFYAQEGAADQLADRCKQVLLDRQDDGNYFLWAHFIDPHAPYLPPQEYVDEFSGDELYHASVGPEVPHYEDGMSGTFSVGRIPPVAQIEDHHQVRDYVVRYDAEIRYLDRVLEDLWNWMKEKQLLENTIVVFTSDHGESLGDHNYFFEHGRYPYDACTRVPLFIHHPDLKPSVIEEPVALMDIVPTVLEALELPPGFQTEGKSLLSWLESGGPTEEVRPVITESGYSQRFCVAVRRGPWKLIKISDTTLRKELTGSTYELYHVLNDPGETRNLIEDPDPAIQEAFTRLRPVLDRETKDRHAKKGLAQLQEVSTEVDETLRALGYVDGE